MRILIDINHPAHVHYFRNFIKIMEAKGHTFCVINRNSEIINQLLDYYGIEHIVRGKRGKNKKKLFIIYGLLKTVKYLTRISRKQKVDMFVGFASAPCALTSFVTRRPSILLDDTDHNLRNQAIYLPFCSKVLVPFYFGNKLFRKRIAKMKSHTLMAYIEQLYLHSCVYQPGSHVLNMLGLKPQQYVIVRFSAFDASHDQAVKHIDIESKKAIIREIEKNYRVILSLENTTDDNFFNKRVVSFPPHLMHDLLFHAKYLVTEGATMASEAYVLGVPYIYLNPLHCGYINYQCEHQPNRAKQTIDCEKILKIVEQYQNEEINQTMAREAVERNTIQPTAFLTWYVENYPESKKIIKKDPDYQYIFR